jgi:hypothetical protein
MSLYLPDGRGGYTKQTGEAITIPEPHVPQHLREDLDANPHLEPLYFEAVGKALTESLGNPATALRNPTQQALKERIEICLNAIVVMRQELYYALRKCFDLLPQALMCALIHGTRLDDEMAKSQLERYWHRTKEQETHGTAAMGVGGADASDDITPEARDVELDEAAVSAYEETKE